VEIREAIEADWPAVWAIVEPVVRAGETYALARDMTEAEAKAYWMRPAPGIVLVAVEGDAILGSAKIVPNQAGGGAHVANGSFMVGPAARGRGVGRRLGEAALERARAAGFRAMQFNAVVESNRVAVDLWLALGYAILTTVPEAFDHPKDGLVGLHILYRRL
jgi:GNAT superfamily N-acetyltransferase